MSRCCSVVFFPHVVEKWSKNSLPSAPFSSSVKAGLVSVVELELMASSWRKSAMRRQSGIYLLHALLQSLAMKRSLLDRERLREEQQEQFRGLADFFFVEVANTLETLFSSLENNAAFISTTQSVKPFYIYILQVKIKLQTVSKMWFGKYPDIYRHFY